MKCSSLSRCITLAVLSLACASLGHSRCRWRGTRAGHPIFRLLLHQFGVMSGKLPLGDRRAPATLWRVTGESWLRCQNLIAVRRNQKPDGSTTSPKKWSHY
jgi:hypothetical protein